MSAAQGVVFAPAFWLGGFAFAGRGPRVVRGVLALVATGPVWLIWATSDPVERSLVPAPTFVLGLLVLMTGVAWGGSQLFTGRLSDHVGRRWPNVLGMWICGTGVALFLFGGGVAWWSFAAGVSGFGMALLYPNLSAAVTDISPPSWRGSAIGIYRFWRDLGYGIGALGLGLAAHVAGSLEEAFWFVAAAMLLSGGLLWWWGEETHPRLNPAAA